MPITGSLLCLALLALAVQALVSSAVLCGVSHCAAVLPRPPMPVSPPVGSAYPSTDDYNCTQKARQATDPLTPRQPRFDFR